MQQQQQKALRKSNQNKNAASNSTPSLLYRKMIKILSKFNGHHCMIIIVFPLPPARQPNQSTECKSIGQSIDWIKRAEQKQMQ